MQPSPTDVPVPNSEFHLEEFDGELLLYHPGLTKTVYLNPTASLVWQLCDGQRSAREIMELLRESFPDDSAGIEKDVTTTLEMFDQYGAVRLRAS
jgi:hypothetical protein